MSENRIEVRDGSSGGAIDVETERADYDRSIIKKIIKLTYREIYLRGYMEVGSAQKERLIKQLEKKPGYITTNAAMVKIFAAIFMLFMNITVLFLLDSVLPTLGNVTPESYVYTAIVVNTSISVIYFIQFMFIFTYGVSSFVGLFGAAPFKWLSIQPLDEKTLKRVIIKTAFKTVDYQSYAILFGLPVTVAYSCIKAGLPIFNIILTVSVTFISSLLNLIYLLSFMVYLGYFMAVKIFRTDETSPMRTVMRIVFVMFYLASGLTIYFVFTFFTDWITGLLRAGPYSGTDISLITLIMSLIPYPTGAASPVGFSLTLPYYFDTDTFIILSSGFSVSILIAVILARGASGKILWLVDISYGTIVGKKEKAGRVKVTVSKKKEYTPIIRSPVAAIAVKDLRVCTRNFSYMMYILFPVFMSLILLIPLMGMLEESSGDYMQDMVGIYSIFASYIPMMVSFSVYGLTSAEGSSNYPVYTLPVKNSDVFRAKLGVTSVTMLLGILIGYLLVMIMGVPEPVLTLIFFILLGVFCIFTSVLFYMLYGLLFGSMPYGGTLMMVKYRFKVAKIILAFLIFYGFFAFQITALYILWHTFDGMTAVLSVTLFTSVITAVLFVVADKSVFKTL